MAPPIALRLAPKGLKKRPRAQLQAPDETIGEEKPVAEWASLFGDVPRVTRDGVYEPVAYGIHDKGHLEFAIEYGVASDETEYNWEAYFFVPESFRLNDKTYPKKELYDDLLSYVRLAVPDIPFRDLSSTKDGEPLGRLRAALAAARGTGDGSPEAHRAIRVLRLFACVVRASSVAAMRHLEHEIDQLPGSKESVVSLGRSFAASTGAVAAAFRRILAENGARGLSDDVAMAAKWIDEDLSMVLETLSANVGVKLEHASVDAPELHELAEIVAVRAVGEARHRVDQGYDSVGSASATDRQIEHLEFRRHVLKRFSSSVLWLTLEVRDRADWVLHTLYAFAAALAMTFATIASLKTSTLSNNFYKYSILVVMAYAVKDRLKAYLQSVFSGYANKHFPDRQWNVRDRERGKDIGRGDERAGFLPFSQVPDDVLGVRRLTREHPLEEQARPEQVLYHRKRMEVARPPGNVDLVEFPQLTEILRLNVRQWLQHTDDPNRKIAFADPRDARIYAATARRVYNVNVVYRLRRGDEPTAWRRLRLVVTRKGIERIDAIR